MPPSRSTINAKLLQKHQRKQSVSQASSSGNKFTQKQSHFERRREEEQIRSVQRASIALPDSITSSTTATPADGLLTRGKWGEAGRVARPGEMSGSFTSGATETPSPFALHQKNVKRSTVAVASTRSATMGLGGTGVKMTRTTRRAQKFQLGDGDGTSMGVQSRFGGSLEQGTLLGASLRRPREGDEDGNDGGEDAAPRKLTREEKFREVMANSKSQRAQNQRDRAAQEEHTKALDQEINALLHLLPKRDKQEEEQEAFANSGTPGVRALLHSIKQKPYSAKQLSLKSSGDYTITPLAVHGATTTTAAAEGRATAAGARGATAEEAEEGDITAVALLQSEKKQQMLKSGETFLDAADAALLSRIRSGAAMSVEETHLKAEINSASAASTSSTNVATAPERSNATTRQLLADSAIVHYAEDDFDVMMNKMRLDERRAHAVDRTLTEQEQGELDAQQALLEADRATMPTLGLQEKDMLQLTRGEWVQRGGDEVFHMDDEEGMKGIKKKKGGAIQDDDDDVYGDNVDIPSSYEGDSDEDRGVGEGADSEDEGKMKEEGEQQPKVGSVILDRLLSDFEKLANTQVSASNTGEEEEAEKACEQRACHFHALLLQLHRYARTHILEVANTFRLILIEAERSFLRSQRKALSRPLLLYLYVIMKLFPMTDYRHEVATPFLLFLCSTLLQMKLDTLENVHCCLALNGLLISSLRLGGGKFAAEAVVAALNVVALQLPLSVIEPARHQGVQVPIPVVERSDDALLSIASAPSFTGEDVASAQLEVLYTEGQVTAEHLLLCAYRQLGELAEMYRNMPALPTVLVIPFFAIDKLLLGRPSSSSAAVAGEKSSRFSWSPSVAVRSAHESLATRLHDFNTFAEEHRAPLAMRAFRPRPIRLFEPLLAEQEENAVKTEIREMKREIREDKKRVMRHLTAEATVQRRAREKEVELVDQQRERKYHQLMGQLQSQQHIMNTVDAVMSKAKSKQKKGISGAPKAAGGGEGGAE